MKRTRPGVKRKFWLLRRKHDRGSDPLSCFCSYRTKINVNGYIGEIQKDIRTNAAISKTRCQKSSKIRYSCTLSLFHRNKVLIINLLRVLESHGII